MNHYDAARLGGAEYGAELPQAGQALPRFRIWPVWIAHSESVSPMSRGIDEYRIIEFEPGAWDEPVERRIGRDAMNAIAVEHPEAWVPRRPICADLFFVHADRTAQLSPLTLRLRDDPVGLGLAVICTGCDGDRPFDGAQVRAEALGKQITWLQYARPMHTALLSLTLEHGSRGRDPQTVASAVLTFVDDASATNKGGVRPVLALASSYLHIDLHIQ